MHGFISGLSFFFHWSICLFLCQYHTVLMDCSFVVVSEVRKLASSSSILSLKTALAIQGLLCFHMNCECFCSSSVKNAIGNLIGGTLNL